MLGGNLWSCRLATWTHGNEPLTVHTSKKVMIMGDDYETPYRTYFSRTLSAVRTDFFANGLNYAVCTTYYEEK